MLQRWGDVAGISSPARSTCSSCRASVRIEIPFLAKGFSLLDVSKNCEPDLVDWTEAGLAWRGPPHTCKRADETQPEAAPSAPRSDASRFSVPSSSASCACVFAQAFEDDDYDSGYREAEAFAEKVLLAQKQTITDVKSAADASSRAAVAASAALAAVAVTKVRRWTWHGAVAFSERLCFRRLFLPTLAEEGDAFDGHRHANRLAQRVEERGRSGAGGKGSRGRHTPENRERRTGARGAGGNDRQPAALALGAPARRHSWTRELSRLVG
jgi:hypothetical protein